MYKISEERIQDVVSCYRKSKDYKRAKKEFGEIGNTSLSDLIAQEACCQYKEGQILKRYDHQMRIRTKALEDAQSELEGIQADLKKEKSFDKLHVRIKDKIGSITGIGPLTVYDISLRIAVCIMADNEKKKKKLKPDLLPKSVYLHSGTCVGAEVVWGAEYVKDKSKIDPPFFKAFSPLKPYQIEDCLCICKDCFGKDRNSSKCTCKSNTKKSKC